MLYIIGLGLSDVEDITVKGLNAVRSSHKVYLEHYTSILGGGPDYTRQLEKFYEKSIILADRDMVEQNSDEIILSAKEEGKNVSFLVVGDPFGATTHTDLVLRAIDLKVEYHVIHNASIMNAIGCCGLQLYNYGETISMCFWSDSWRPKSYALKICENRRATRGLHTLCLLDIKVKEKSVENLVKGRDIWEPPRFMTVTQACAQLIEIINESKTKAKTKLQSIKKIESDEEEEENKEEKALECFVASGVLDENTLGVGLARVGRSDQCICVDTLRNLADTNQADVYSEKLGGPLHSLIIAGKLHPLEIDFLKSFVVKGLDEDKRQSVIDSFENKVNLHNEFYKTK